jgi:hypothetical protein
VQLDDRLKELGLTSLKYGRKDGGNILGLEVYGGSTTSVIYESMYFFYTSELINHKRNYIVHDKRN